MIFLETTRLVLRNVEEKDVPVMVDYRNNALCTRYQRGQKKDAADIAALAERRKVDVLSAEAPCLVALALKETDEMIGEIVVMPQEDTFSLGYTLHYAHHRKGYAFEALSALIEYLHGLQPGWEFISFVHPDNIASKGLLEKLGYGDLGYIPGMDSCAFGKWVKPETVEEVAQAIRNSK